MTQPTCADAKGPRNWREPDLLGQTVVVIGGSAGIGLATAPAHPAAPPKRRPAAFKRSLLDAGEDRRTISRRERVP